MMFFEGNVRLLERAGGAALAFSQPQSSMAIGRYSSQLPRTHTTTVYVDCVPVQTLAHIQLSNPDLSGYLVAGTWPFGSDAWSGELPGPALYEWELTRADAFRHYQAWMKYGRPNLDPAGIPLALYLFDERAGEVVRDHGKSGIDLSFPTRYAILDQVFLEPMAERGLSVDHVNHLALGPALCAASK